MKTNQTIIDLLGQKKYCCVKYNQNKERLSDLFPLLGGETGICLIRKSLNQLDITREYLKKVSPDIRVSSQDESFQKYHLITDKILVKNYKKVFEHFSVLIFDDFQKSSLYELAIMDLWEKSENKKPFLVFSSVVYSYQKIPLPLGKDRSIEFPKNEPTTTTFFSKTFYPVNSEDLLKDLSEKVTDYLKDKKSYRILVILPTLKKIESFKSLLGEIKNTTLIEFTGREKNGVLYQKTNHVKNYLILSLDFSRSGVFLDGIDHVFDSGETTRIYTPEGGEEKTFIKKIDKEDFFLRKTSYYPTYFTTMITEKESFNLKNSTLPEIYRKNIYQNILYLIDNGVKDFSFLSQNLREKKLKDLFLLNAITSEGGKLTEIGKFFLSLDLNIFNLYFLWNSEKKDMFASAIFVSILEKKIYVEDFYKLFVEKATRFSKDTRVGDEIEDLLDFLIERLDISTTIFDPKKAWEKIKKNIPRSYLSKIYFYRAGEYKNSEKKVCKIKSSSKTVLVVSYKTNEKGISRAKFFINLD